MKRKNEEEEEESSDDDFGPKAIVEEEPKRKKRRVLEFEKVYLEALPSGQMYETSYMHRDVVTHVVVSQATDFVITGSADGHIKFWKKMIKLIDVCWNEMKFHFIRAKKNILLKLWDLSGAQDCKSCRPRKMLKNDS